MPYRRDGGPSLDWRVCISCGKACKGRSDLVDHAIEKHGMVRPEYKEKVKPPTGETMFDLSLYERNKY